MAAQNAEDFLLRLNQQISGPASIAASSLAKLESQIRAEESALHGMEDSLRAAKAKLNDLQQGFGGKVDIAGITKARAEIEKLQAKIEAGKDNLDTLAGSRGAVQKSGEDADAAKQAKVDAASKAKVDKQAANDKRAADKIAIADAAAKVKADNKLLADAEKDAKAYSAFMKKQDADAAKAKKATDKAVIADAAAKDKAEKKSKSDAEKDAKAYTAFMKKQDADAVKSAAKKASDAKKSADKIAKDAKEAAKASDLSKIKEAAEGADGPLGRIASGFDKIKAVGAVGVFVAIAVAIIAIGVAAIAAAVALTQFAIASADASRSSALLSRAAAGGAAVGAELEAVINDVANKTPMARDKIAEMARSMEVAHLAGRNMQNALEAATTASSAMGDAAGNALKGIAEKAQAARRFMLSKNDLTGLSAELEGTGLAFNDVAAAVAAAQGVSVERAAQMIRKGQVSVKVGLEAMNAAVQQKFGKTVAAQMLSLNTQFAKMKEGIGRLFDGVDIEPFLRGLKLITGLFSEQTVTGAALKTLFNSMFNGIAAASESVFPIISAYLRGMVVAALAAYIGYIKVSKAIKDAFGGESASKIDWIKTAMWAGVISVVAIGAALFALVAIIALVIASAVIMAVILLSPFLLAAAGVYLLIAAFNWITTTLNDAVIAAFRAAGAAISGAFSAAGNAVGAAFSYIVSLLSAFTGIDLSAAGTKIVTGLVNGIKSGATFVIEAIKSLGTSAMSALTSVLGIHSPSRVFAMYGEYTAQGFGQGVEEGTPDANESVKRLGAAEPSKGPQQVSQPRGGDTFIFNYYGPLDAFDDFKRRVLDVFEQEARGGPDFAT